MPVPATRLVVLVSGAGTNLQALLDAAQEPSYGAQVVAVGADREDTEGLARADRAGVPTFVRRVDDFLSRGHWDSALTDTVGDLKGANVIGRWTRQFSDTSALRVQAYADKGQA